MDLPTRNQQIRHMRAQGRSLRNIAKTFGISFERVRQIAPSPTPKKRRKDTRKQVYDFLVAYMTAHCGQPPPLREIQRALGMSSISVAFYHLQQLAAEGRIAFFDEPSLSRGFYLPGSTWTPPPSSPNTTP